MTRGGRTRPTATSSRMGTCTRRESATLAAISVIDRPPASRSQRCRVDCDHDGSSAPAAVSDAAGSPMSNMAARKAASRAHDSALSTRTATRANIRLPSPDTTCAATTVSCWRPAARTAPVRTADR